jgi:outer membrane protein assembly factor BamB
VTALLPATGAFPARAAEATAPVPASQAGTPVERLFQAADRDRDGRLSPAEVESWPRVSADFHTIDTDQDGFISRQELGAALFRWWQQQGAAKSAPNTQAAGRAGVGGSGARSETRRSGAANREAAAPATRERSATLDQHSPQFRGPRGDGVAHGANLPNTWSATSNIMWSCPIPGKGWSSPIVWGDRIFVTSAAGAGPVEPPPAKLGSVAEHVRGVTATDVHRYLLHCVDWRSGKLLWSRVAHEGVPPGPIHPKGSHASETPVTDGERVYAYFGGVGLYCYDLDGRALWSRQWGSFKMDWNWGTSASPVLHGDLLFVLNDNQEASFLAALDKRTGKDVWRVARAEKSNWSSPFVWEQAGGAEIVTAGSGRVRSYDLGGKVLWELRGMSNVTVPTPFAAEGLLYLASGNTGSPNKPVYAIRPGARGDISLPAGATSNAHIAWCQRKAAPYVTSPLVYDDILYVLLDGGFLAAYDARTGAEIYDKQRFPGGRAAFTASPWAYDGKIFCLAETGETYVVAAGREFRVLHINRLGETALATPAVARDSVILRTLTQLHRIAGVAEVMSP